MALAVVRGGVDDAVDSATETAGVSTTGSVAGLEAGRGALATRAGADFVFGDATGFSGGNTMVSGVGDDEGAGAEANSDSGAGDETGPGVSTGVGSASAICDAAGAGPAVRRAITKPTDATDTTIAATAAAMKRDPEDI